MKQRIKLTDTKTNKSVTKSYKEKSENRFMNDTFMVFISKLSSELNVKPEMCSTTWSHTEETRTTYTEITVSSVGAEFNTDEYSLTILPYSDSGVEIYKIESSKPKSGIGTKLMNTVLDVSDDLDIQVNLVPVPFMNKFGVHGVEMIKLIGWYKSFGFKSNQLSKYLKYN